MATYTLGDMKARIAADIARVGSDLSTGSVGSTNTMSHIAWCIQDAIKQYERHRFVFSEKAYATWASVANQELYTTADSGFPSDLVAIDSLTAVYSSVRYPVRQKSWSEIEFLQDGSFKGNPPTHYAYYQQEIRVFPIPTATTTTFNLAYWQRPAAISADSDAGVWMNDAEELIRSSAKRRLFLHVIVDEAQADLMAIAEEEALRELKKEAALRIGTGRIRPTLF